MKIEPELAHELLTCPSVQLMSRRQVSSVGTRTPGDEPYGGGFQTQFRDWIVGADRKIDRMAGSHRNGPSAPWPRSGGPAKLLRSGSEARTTNSRRIDPIAAARHEGPKRTDQKASQETDC